MERKTREKSKSPNKMKSDSGQPELNNLNNSLSGNMESITTNGLENSQQIVDGGFEQSAPVESSVQGGSYAETSVK